uniref:MADS-box domain-containing protein n=1 Tax=Spongospora subterranea TaxID=70186 RepID=A0A0H5RAW9_9EUKA|eukprot:CRZ11315.1 hypothetical protein [Spongospora subterranea]
MGRRKIKIEMIADKRNRTVTFNKRKLGLMKKAIELSVLCGTDIALVIFGQESVYKFSTFDFNTIFSRYEGFPGPVHELSVDDLDDLEEGRIGVPTGKKRKGSQLWSPPVREFVDQVPAPTVASIYNGHEHPHHPATNNCHLVPQQQSVIMPFGPTRSSGFTNGDASDYGNCVAGKGNYTQYDSPNNSHGPLINETTNRIWPYPYLVDPQSPYISPFVLNQDQSPSYHGCFASAHCLHSPPEAAILPKTHTYPQHTQMIKNIHLTQRHQSN